MSPVGFGSDENNNLVRCSCGYKLIIQKGYNRTCNKCSASWYRCSRGIVTLVEYKKVKKQ